MGSRGQAVMKVEYVRVHELVISRFAILLGTDERNRPRNMYVNEFTH